MQKRVAWQILGIFCVIAASGCASGRSAPPDVAGWKPPARTVQLNVHDFGAIGNGRTDDSKAIAAAIAACNSEGGGAVHFPPGKYLTKPIVFVSHLTLDLDAGATILFSTNPEDYPLTLSRWEGTECYNFCPQIGGRGLTDIAIVGQGTLDGQGDAWYPMQRRQSAAIDRLRRMNDEGTPVEQRKFGTVKDGLRPPMIQFWECSGVYLQGVTIGNSPFWTVTPVYCRDVFAQNLKIYGNGPNTDGLDPDSCSNVWIDHCTFDTGDDCIAIKSGRNLDGRRVNRPCENINVIDCTMLRGHGGVSIGSEMSGCVRNVTIRDCHMVRPDRGIYIKTMRGRGGIVEDIVASNITMDNIKQDGFAINMLYNKADPEPISNRTPTVRNVRIGDVRGHASRAAIALEGLDERHIENVRVDDFSVTAPGENKISNVDGFAVYAAGKRLVR